MEFEDEAWDDPEGDPGCGTPDESVGPGELYRRLVSDEEGRRYWSERAWSHDDIIDDVADGVPLFADQHAEAELAREMRLAELWESCQRGTLTMEEFFELSALITEVDGITGSLCVDCAMLDRPNVSANWALATTTLCRGHLRFRLGYARIDGGGAPFPA